MEALTIDRQADAFISITTTASVESARRLVRSFCLEAGLSRHKAEELVVAASELATNVVRHSGASGTIRCRLAKVDGRRCIEIECVDQGSGISDLAEAMREGFSSIKGSLGGGLSSARELVDEFSVESEPGTTRIRMRKWLTQP